MSLRVVPVTADTLELWRRIHNQIIPTTPLSPAEVADRASRHHLTLAYEGVALVGNATVRPPPPDAATATVIVRVLPPFRRRGLGWEYFEAMLGQARGLGATRIETVVLASNSDGLSFALARGFVEHDRYTLEGTSTPFIDLHLAEESSD